LLQWEIYDAYIADQEKQRAQEEVNKQKAAAKKATTATETAETSQDPAKACFCSHCVQDGCCALDAFVHFLNGNWLGHTWQAEQLTMLHFLWPNHPMYSACKRFAYL